MNDEWARGDLAVLGGMFAESGNLVTLVYVEARHAYYVDGDKVATLPDRFGWDGRVPVACLKEVTS